MKYDKFQYDRIFEILKNKIEVGRMPKGTVLPSYADLCSEYKVSNKTIRRVMAMLSDAGLIETRERQPSVVVFERESRENNTVDNLEKPNGPSMTDILKTAEILCYPLIVHGVSLCSRYDWDIPEKIAQQLNPELPTLFWKNSKLFWRFFIARCENELSLHTVDALGFLDLDYRENNYESRVAYKDALLGFTARSRISTSACDAVTDFLTDIHRVIISRDNFECYVPADSPFRIGVGDLDKWMKTAEERYSSVYLDILGLIAIGYYQPGDRLPSHIQMQKQYGVSVNTTTQAIHCLQEWGIVEATRGRGIFVSTNKQALNDIYIDPRLIASHIRRYLEGLELLSLTAKGVAEHVADQASTYQIQNLIQKLEEAKKCGSLYQPAPVIMLEFIADQISYDALQSIYMVILKNYRIGRKIPKLINRSNAARKREIHGQCLEAANRLLDGDRSAFTKGVVEMFEYTHQLVIEECKRLGYWKTVKRIYDGSQLWK